MMVPLTLCVFRFSCAVYYTVQLFQKFSPVLRDDTVTFRIQYYLEQNSRLLMRLLAQLTYVVTKSMLYKRQLVDQVWLCWL